MRKTISDRKAAVQGGTQIGQSSHSLKSEQTSQKGASRLAIRRWSLPAADRMYHWSFHVIFALPYNADFRDGEMGGTDSVCHFAPEELPGQS